MAYLFLSEQADHAQTKLNAKLDLLTRLYESRAAASAAVSAPSTPSNYDDSDEEVEGDEDDNEEQEESRETDDASADIEAMLLEDKSMAVEVRITPFSCDADDERLIDMMYRILPLLELMVELDPKKFSLLFEL